MSPPLIVRRIRLPARAFILALVSIVALSLESIHCEEIHIGDYRLGLDAVWKEKVFRGRTSYELVQINGGHAVKAESRTSASALYHEIDLVLTDYPVLTWSWKIEGVLQRGDGRKKEGDDYAARLYVVFPSWLFWKTKTISYVWANKIPVGEVLESPYTANAAIIPLRSGNEKAGQWVREKRNVLEDFRQYFKEDPPPCKAIAIMTDTDNTGESATAWYGPIWAKSQS
jgi:hypothetical protein